MRVQSCGVPDAHCNGRSVICDMNVIRKTIKVHNTPQEAFRCYSRYLVNVLGYKRLGSREFQLGEDAPILVLTKASRFGAPFRHGKYGGEGAGRGKRVTPYGKQTGGWIASY